MATAKLTTWNIEWMNRLFDLKSSTTKLKKTPAVIETCERIAGVIKDISPDILGIQEGPASKARMAHFVREYLDDGYEVYSVPSGTQSNHALVKKGLDIEVKQLPMSHKVYTYLSRNVEFYTWSEVKKQSSKKIPRKPVVLSLNPPDKPDEKVELMIFHTKSKISDLRSKKQWENRDVEAIVDALRSRQRLSGELAAVRRYLTHAILSKRAEGCIVIGDLNEGPNRDIFEEKFLLTNIVDELRGGFHREEALMHHALEREWLDPDRALAYSAEFRDPTQDGKKVKTLLDHIMVSTSIRHGKAPFKIRAKDGLIEHDLFEKHVKNSGNKRNERPSDHVPVTTILRYK
ncbi:MAG: endonuclease/exonuclease/phosphatase family protein [Hyphomicrobiales bacterium]